MKKLRPIKTPKPQDPHRKAQRGLLRHFALSHTVTLSKAKGLPST